MELNARSLFNIWYNSYQEKYPRRLTEEETEEFLSNINQFSSDGKYGRLLYKTCGLTLCWGRDITVDVYCHTRAKGHPLIGLLEGNKLVSVLDSSDTGISPASFWDTLRGSQRFLTFSAGEPFSFWGEEQRVAVLENCLLPSQLWIWEEVKRNLYSEGNSKMKSGPEKMLHLVHLRKEWHLVEMKDSEDNVDANCNLGCYVLDGFIANVAKEDAKKKCDVDLGSMNDASSPLVSSLKKEERWKKSLKKDDEEVFSMPSYFYFYCNNIDGCKNNDDLENDLLSILDDSCAAYDIVCEELGMLINITPTGITDKPLAKPTGYAKDLRVTETSEPFLGTCQAIDLNSIFQSFPQGYYDLKESLQVTSCANRTSESSLVNRVGLACLCRNLVYSPVCYKFRRKCGKKKRLGNLEHLCCSQITVEPRNNFKISAALFEAKLNSLLHAAVYYKVFGKSKEVMLEESYGDLNLHSNADKRNSASKSLSFCQTSPHLESSQAFTCDVRYGDDVSFENWHLTKWKELLSNFEQKQATSVFCSESAVSWGSGYLFASLEEDERFSIESSGSVCRSNEKSSAKDEDAFAAYGWYEPSGPLKNAAHYYSTLKENKCFFWEIRRLVASVLDLTSRREGYRSCVSENSEDETERSCDDSFVLVPHAFAWLVEANSAFFGTGSDVVSKDKIRCTLDPSCTLVVDIPVDARDRIRASEMLADEILQRDRAVVLVTVDNEGSFVKTYCNLLPGGFIFDSKAQPLHLIYQETEKHCRAPHFDKTYKGVWMEDLGRTVEWAKSILEDSKDRSLSADFDVSSVDIRPSAWLPQIETSQTRRGRISLEMAAFEVFEQKLAPIKDRILGKNIDTEEGDYENVEMLLNSLDYPNRSHPLLVFSLIKVQNPKLFGESKSFYWPNVPDRLLGFFMHSYLSEGTFRPNYFLICLHVRAHVTRALIRPKSNGEMEEIFCDYMKPPRYVLLALKFRYDCHYATTYPNEFEICKLWDSKRVCTDRFDKTPDGTRNQNRKSIGLRKLEDSFLPNAQACILLDG
jgi:hypothetical protein